MNELKSEINEIYNEQGLCNYVVYCSDKYST